jgi:hypothetical protein
MGQEGIVRAAINAYPSSIDVGELPKEFLFRMTDDCSLNHVLKKQDFSNVSLYGSLSHMQNAALTSMVDDKSRVFVSKAANLSHRALEYSGLLVFLPSQIRAIFPHFHRAICGAARAVTSH